MSTQSNNPKSVFINLFLIYIKKSKKKDIVIVSIIVFLINITMGHIFNYFNYVK